LWICFCFVFVFSQLANGESGGLAGLRFLWSHYLHSDVPSRSRVFGGYGI
jgi:hypothetical protein